MKRKAEATQSRHAKLVSMGKSSYVSQAGLEKLCTAIDEEGLPTAFSRRTQYRARKTVCATRTPYGSLVESEAVVGKNGAEIKVSFQNPLAMLYYLAANSDDYCEVLEAALQAHPPSPSRPWRVVLYQDGIDPSDGLAKHHTRKACAFYWSFLEYGISALSHEEMWCTPTVARSTVVNQMPGVHVQLAAMVVRRFFDPDGHDIRRAGVTLRLKSGVCTTIFAEWGVLVADEPAIKEVLSCKGHAGTKPCVLCMNVVLHRSGLHASEYAVSIADANFERVKLHDGTTLRRAVEKLHSYRHATPPLPQARYDLLESLYGFTYNPHQLILNERLRLDAVSIVMFDWAHCLVADGIADVEMGICMKTMHRASTNYVECGLYVGQWVWPRHACNVSELFATHTIRNNLRKENFTCTASEFLTVAPVLARYFQYVGLPRGEQLPCIKSMLAALWVVELLQAVKRGFVTPVLLRAAIETHFGCFLAAYGEDMVRPKHHYIRHLPDILHRHGTLISTLMHERKHRVCLRYLRPRCNTAGFERGVMEDVTCHCIWDVTQPFLRLQGGSKPRPQAMSVLQELYPSISADAFQMHARARVHHGEATNKDMVIFMLDNRYRVGQLLVLFSAEGNARSVLRLWSIRRSATDDDAYANLDEEDRCVNVPTSSILVSVICLFSADRRTCTVCVPFGYRGSLM